MQIGIDLGATKIESIVLDDKGEELYREREESPHNYQETLNSINLIVNKIDLHLQRMVLLKMPTIRLGLMTKISI